MDLDGTDFPRNGFAHLNLHSNYSLLSGGNRVEEVVAAAKVMGMEAVALTDTNGMHGVVPFYQAATQAGVKPIIGVEIDLEGVRMILLARNSRGYSALCEITTRRQLDDDFPMEHNPVLHRRERDGPEKAKTGDADGFGRGNNGGRDDGSNGILRKGKSGRGFTEAQTGDTKVGDPPETRALEKVDKIGQWLDEVLKPGKTGKGDADVFIITQHEGLIRKLARGRFRGCLYIELRNYGGYESRKELERLGSIAAELSLPCVATNNVYFVEREGHFRHRLLSAIRLNTTLEKLSRDETANPQCWMKPSSEMWKLFPEIPEAVENALKIAEMCNVEMETGKMRLPVFPLPKGTTADSYLRRVCMTGARKRYGRITPEVRKRIDYELSVIRKLGYAPYFLVVWDIARYAWKNSIPSVGRGSAANSIVSYCLGLTHVCPIRHNLFFERFLNLERKDCPDVDLDFCWKRRDRVLDYVYDHYGHDHVAMICTFNTLGIKSSLREVAKVHGLLNDEISEFTKRLPHYGFGALDKIVEEVPECRDLPVDREPWKTIIREAKEIANYPRHLGVHPGGIVISPCPITELVPLQYTAKGILITQYDMDPIEDIGLVKIDLLGQRALAAIADTVDALRKRNKIGLNMANLDEGDERTIEMWKSARTIGCFQIESPSMRGLLRKLKVDGIGILTAASSIVRPGPSDGGMTKKFIDRYNGAEEVTYEHPMLEKILGETLGVMVYQEDVIKVVHELAGIGFGEAEMLRKSMSKKRGIEAVASYEKRFIKGARERGIPKETAEEIWRQISAFAGYAFCKAHSASYAQVSYQATFLKTHFPAEFMAAVIANGGGFYGTYVYVNEARRLGLEVLPPDVNLSEKDCTGEDDWIRIGLMSVRDLSLKSAKRIIECREEMRFGSMQDFHYRTGIGRGEVENLVKCGAFDALGKTRPQLLWEAEMIFGDGLLATAAQGASSRKKHAVLCETPDLFYGFQFIASGSAPTELRDYDIEKKIIDEMGVLGFAVSSHPIEPHLHRMKKLGAIPIRDVPNYPGKMVTVIGMLVTTRRVRTVKGEHMRFVTLEDMTGTVETVLFPKVYGKWGGEISSLGPYIVTGTVEDEYGHFTLGVESFKGLE